MSHRALHPPTSARKLRQGSTDAERRLWAIIRDRQLGGCKFRRQHPIGPFIADFACVERMLIVEADGAQHVDSEADFRRTAWLEGQGWRVMRFWNNEILMNSEGVAASILVALGQGGQS
jgi:primosomal protein N' (replication factor Y)